MTSEMIFEEEIRETTDKEEVDTTTIELEVTKPIPRRLASIDFVKGIAIIFIIIAHTSAAWLDENWIFLNGIVYAFLDIFGPSLFIFLSALSVVFSINRKKGVLPEPVIRNTIFARGLMMLFIGSLINFALNGAELDFPLSLWGWNIISFIGLSQIVCYFTVKLSRAARAIIGTIIIFSSEVIRDVLWDLSQTNDFFYAVRFILDSPEATTTVLPWISICFITTIFGEYLYEAMMESTDEAYKRLFNIFRFWGILFLIFGIVTGIETVNPAMGNINGRLYKFDVYYTAIRQPYVRYPGMWKFLVRGTFSNMWYTMGASFLIIAAGFYLTDIKKKENIFIDMVKFYGTVSLNLFLLHYLLLPFYSSYMSILVYPYFVLTYIGLLGFLFYFWYAFWDGKGTPEWLMSKATSLGAKRSKK